MAIWDDDCRYLIVVKRNIEIIIIKLIAVHNVIITQNFDFNEEDTVVVVCSIIFQKMNSSLFFVRISFSVQYPIEYMNCIVQRIGKDILSNHQFNCSSARKEDI